eukprot:m.183145 g.183145  ORF g.183145 m.183145 type:complete len:59 (-) comp14688_c0_seq2:646-822(-)
MSEPLVFGSELLDICSQIHRFTLAIPEHGFEWVYCLSLGQMSFECVQTVALVSRKVRR